MTFHEQFINALNSEQTGLSDNTEYVYPKFIPVSQEAAETFFYVQGIRNYLVSYPYSHEIYNLDSYYILYTLSGKGQLYYRSKKYQLIPNSFVFICCIDDYRIEAKTSNWNFFGIYINGSKTSEYYKLYSRNDFVSCPVSKLSHMYRILLKLFHHQKSKTSQMEMINSKIITDLLTEMLVNKAHYQEQTNRIPDYILDIKQFFDHHYSHNITLDSLAKDFRISKYKLAREFTYYISESPINYLIKTRISIAKEMLWQTNKTVNEISESVGIENASHFIRLFKKHTGLTPMMFRKQKANNIIYYTRD